MTHCNSMKVYNIVRANPNATLQEITAALHRIETAEGKPQLTALPTVRSTAANLVRDGALAAIRDVCSTPNSPDKNVSVIRFKTTARHVTFTAGGKLSRACRKRLRRVVAPGKSMIREPGKSWKGMTSVPTPTPSAAAPVAQEQRVIETAVEPISAGESMVTVFDGKEYVTFTANQAKNLRNSLNAIFG